MTAYTAADLMRLDAAIANGMTSLEIAGRRISYRSIDEMLKARAHIEAQIAAASSPQPSARRRVTFSTARGF